MAPTIPTVEPSEFVAGDYVPWNITDATYPVSEGWALSYAFVGSVPFELSETHSPPEITKDLATGIFQVRIPIDITAELAAGTYTWYRYATRGAERYRTAWGSCVVRADKVGAPSTKTKAEAELERIEARIVALEDKITAAAGIKSYTIHGRSVTYRDQVELDSLYKRRGILRSQVRRERDPGRLGRKIGVGFVQPSF